MKKGSHKNRQLETAATDNPLFHDTWKLLKKYRDVVWNLELSVRHLKKSFEIEFGSSIDEFLDSIYLAGVEFGDSRIEHHAKCIEQSNKMVKMLESAVELLRTRHKFGEHYYWVLYYTYLSPQELKSVNEIIDTLQSHIDYISYRTYYRMRKDAIEALSSVLWGYTSKDCIEILERLLPGGANGAI